MKKIILGICGVLALFVVLNSQIRTIVFEFINFKTDKIQTLRLADLGDLPEIEIGDLFFRLGDVYDSVLISKITDFKYSHVGIVVSKTPLMVLHATTDDDEKKQNQVILSSFDEFLSHARDFGIARMKFLNLDEKQQLINSLKSRLGEDFVIAKRGEKNLYCTTLLEREIQKITTFSPKYTHIDTAVFLGEYLTPKAFWQYDEIEIIYEFKR